MSAIIEDLIFDIGMHKGEDSAFYLKKGYRVVAVEADPHLVAHCKLRFTHEVASGALTIIEGALVGNDGTTDSRIPFYRNKTVSQWGTIRHDWRDRNASLGAPSDVVLVDIVSLKSLLTQFGIPYYMKIDIEGQDYACLACLAEMPAVPQYLSVEEDKKSLETIQKNIVELQRLGYTHFAAVQQADIEGTLFTGNDRLGKPIGHIFEAGASGPFGNDISSWLTPNEVLIEYRWITQMYEIFGDTSDFARGRHLETIKRHLSRKLGRPLPGWYDTHASR